jgi:NADPH-dependent glutamate synthase beta subunit-like oxidoreductase
MNCHGYIRLLAQGKEEEAAVEIWKASPFARILGRVCHHPCETLCERGKIDEPLRIRALKRYITDRLPQTPLKKPDMFPDKSYRIAIVGSGPAGLSAAYELRSLGHKVTVYESKEEIGGLLRYGIPSFRLPIAEVEKVVLLLTDMGVEFKTSHAIGKQIPFQDLELQNDAILLAIGASKAVPYKVEGCEEAGIMDGLDLLASAKTNRALELGKRVAVIGGGNSAVDSSLVARRMGAQEVHLICLEEMKDMPAFAAEVQQAREEGIIIQASRGVKRIYRNEEGCLSLELADCLSLFDDNGIFNPELDATCSMDLQVDTVVAAIGQKVDIGRFPERLFSKGQMETDPLTGQSPVNPKVFSCGDCVSGPSSVVNSVASGKEAAISVDRFVRKDGLNWGRGFWNQAYVKEYLVLPERAVPLPRQTPPTVPVEDRGLSTEVEQSFSKEDAVKEAQRCLSCGRAFELHNTCWSCLPCEIECPVNAVEVKMPYLLR